MPKAEIDRGAVFLIIVMAIVIMFVLSEYPGTLVKTGVAGGSNWELRTREETYADGQGDCQVIRKRICTEQDNGFWDCGPWDPPETFTKTDQECSLSDGSKGKCKDGNCIPCVKPCPDVYKCCGESGICCDAFGFSPGCLGSLKKSKIEAFLFKCSGLSPSGITVRLYCKTAVTIPDDLLDKAYDCVRDVVGACVNFFCPVKTSGDY